MQSDQPLGHLAILLVGGAQLPAQRVESARLGARVEPIVQLLPLRMMLLPAPGKLPLLALAFGDARTQLLPTRGLLLGRVYTPALQTERAGGEVCCAFLERDGAYRLARLAADSHHVRVVPVAELVDELKPQHAGDQLIQRGVRLRAHKDAPAPYWAGCTGARDGACACRMRHARYGAMPSHARLLTRHAVSDTPEQAHLWRAAAAASRRCYRRCPPAERAQDVLEELLRGGIVQHIEQCAQEGGLASAGRALHESEAGPVVIHHARRLAEYAHLLVFHALVRALPIEVNQAQSSPIKGDRTWSSSMRW